MEKKRIANQIFVILFILVLVLQYPLWFLLRNSVDTQNHENRQLAALPSLGTPVSQWPSMLEDYIADHAPFRNQFMTLNAAANWALWNRVDNDSVLLGKENWLFYVNPQDNDPIADFQGTTPFTPEELAQITTDLTRLQSALNSREIEFAVLIPPGKEMVYRHLMPASLPIVSPLNKGDQLAAYVQSNSNVRLVWPEAELRNLASSQPVYFQFDSHWNHAGATLAAALLLEELGLPATAPHALEYEITTNPGPVDLLNMSGAWALQKPDLDYDATNWQTGIQTQATYSDDYGYILSYASNSPNNQKLLFFMDSFGAAIQAPLARSFAQSSFVHINGFTESTLLTEQPDIFVLELTQRNLNLFLTYLPRLVQWAEALP